MDIAKNRLGVVLGLAGIVAAATVEAGAPQHVHDHARSNGQPAPISITMEDLHAQGGVPRGWRFLLPPGDAAEGRRVFVALECFACHEVKGEQFPRDSKAARGPGPALTGMGAHHPPEYFAESIINPSRVIVRGAGFAGPDGLSTMPSYAESMTVRQLADVVAYLRSLRSGETTGHRTGHSGPAHDSKAH